MDATKKFTAVKKGTTAANLATGMLLAAGVLLAGCTDAAEAPETAAAGSPTPSYEWSPDSSGTTATPTPEPTRDPRAIAEEAELPFPPLEIGDWAKTAVPTSGADGFVAAYSGWLSDHTSRRLTTRNESTEPGSYVLQFACRGEGTLSLAASTLDDRPLLQDAVVCTNSTVAFDLQVPEVGVQTFLTLDGAPTIYALSFQKVA